MVCKASQDQEVILGEKEGLACQVPLAPRDQLERGEHRVVLAQEVSKE